MLHFIFGPQMRFLKWMQELVSTTFFRHGMFCAKHPEVMILLSAIMVIFCCLPFLSLPMSMTVFHQYTTPLTWFHDPTRNFHTNNHLESETYLDNQAMQPQWFSKPPVGYVLQVVVNTTVFPWHAGLDKHDAFRGPLAKAFDINNDILQYVSSQGQATKSLCYYVTQTARELQPYFPQHSCLVISPANAWTLDYNSFLLDAKPVKSLLDVERVVPSTVKPDLSELLIGFSPWQSGFKRHTIRSRSRQITYAVTVILHTYNESFVRGLQHHLQEKHNPSNLQEKWSTDETILHIHYKNILNLQDISALGAVYCLLLLYVYFSVSRIDMVKSKWGLAFSATILVSLSPLMAVGVTLLLGVETTLNEGEVFPYLVIIIGLENTLVMTNSVASTQMDLDVPTRIATGLSGEGWYIMKNLCTGLSIVFLGHFTFVPAIQEFCLLALIAMLTDFFLQMFFFVPVLSLDFRRTEWDVAGSIRGTKDVAIAIADESVAKKTQSPFDTPSPTHVPGKPSLRTKVPFGILLASLRILQRLIMAFLLLWIIVSFLFIYHSGIAQYIYDSINNNNSTISSATNKVPRVKDHIQYLSKEFMDDNPLSDHKLNGELERGISSFPLPLKELQVTPITYQEPESSLAEGTERFLLSLWLSNKQHWRFSAWHWPALLNFYNISLSNRYISILPPIKLHINIPPSDAINLRLKSEKKRFEDLQGRSKSVDETFYTNIRLQGDLPEEIPEYNFYLTLIFGVASGASLVILMLLLFWCIKVIQNRTPKQYMNTAIPTGDSHLEQFTLCLKGHKQEVEILVYRNGQFISACLGGEIRFWNQDGREVMYLDRRSQNTKMRKSVSHGSLRSLWSPSSMDKSRSLPRSSYSTRCETVDQCYSPDNTSYSPDGLGARTPSVGSLEVGNCFSFESPNANQEEDRKLSASTARSVSPQSHENIYDGGNVVTELCSPIWCLACDEEVLIVGCSDGKIELWDVNYGLFLSCYEESNIGVTDMMLRRNQLVVSRLDGTLQFLLICRKGGNCSFPHNPLSPGIPVQNGVNSSSYGVAVDAELFLINTLREHKGPINKLLLTKHKVISAGQDHLIKVFSLDGNEHHHTFYGHMGSVTTLGYNGLSPSIIASGSTDGTVCTWDLETGRQVHRMKGHHSTVLDVNLTKAHIGSIGMDSKFCIWDQRQGLLLHTIQFDPGCSCTLVPLADKLFITAAQGSLIVWDIESGQPVQLVDLGDCHQAIHRIVIDSDSGSTVMCDYGRELRMVQFHLERNKAE
ncbi:sterol regulatory element-binding protein cleavage-activating protein-like isoform X2 [Apostichopus japonicus]